MVTIAYSWDARGIEGLLRGGMEAALVRALRKAGTDATRAMKAEASRQARDRKRFKASFVNRGLPVTYPRTVKKIDDLMWRMDVEGTLMPVSAFPHRQGRRGVIVEINAGKRTTIKGAFVATMASGHKGVFRREGNKRLPIREAYTSRLSDVFQDADLVPRVLTRTGQVFESAFARVLPVELSRKA